MAVHTTFASNDTVWFLWGGLGILFVIIYMGVYVVIRTKWRDRDSIGEPASGMCAGSDATSRD